MQKKQVCKTTAKTPYIHVNLFPLSYQLFHMYVCAHKNGKNKAWWHMPVITGPQETETRESQVSGQRPAGQLSKSRLQN